jgi:hypothetical protein
METTTMHRSDYLTGAVLLHGSVSDDFADVIVEPHEERITAALKSGFTKALFNGVVAVKHARDPDLMFDLLVSVNRNASQPDEWRIIEEERIDLATTLELIQMELLESAAFCGPDALPLLTAALTTSNDILHFGVLNGVKATGDGAFAPMVRSYIADFDHRDLHADSRSHLLAAANEALDACSPFQLL